MKQVHGGTTADDIIRKVHKAEKLARANAEINGHMYTVLFFDEANTTEAIGLIKEIMCDGTMDGQPLQLSDKLKIVAACNPYRKYVHVQFYFCLKQLCQHSWWMRCHWLEHVHLLQRPDIITSAVIYE